MTIKWVASDPLVMNGEPFCYATRLTVRNVLEMRASGLRPQDIIANHPELRRVGIAEAFLYASRHPERYGAFIGPHGGLRGPGFDPAEAEGLPLHLRQAIGVVVATAPGAASTRPRTAAAGRALPGEGSARQV
jgi:uncharacterized protein (DUF433 family)